MRMRGSILFAFAVVACSSSEPTTASHDAAPDAVDSSMETGFPPGGGAPDCKDGCCKAPTVGAPCVDPTAKCSTSTTCTGGLLLPWTLSCDGAKWTAIGGVCDVGGGVADNGCPTRQPTNGTPCSLPEGTWCQYALVCPAKDCDAGVVDASADGSSGTGCATVAGKVGPAFCRSGAWETTPLGSCP